MTCSHPHHAQSTAAFECDSLILSASKHLPLTQFLDNGWCIFDSKKKCTHSNMRSMYTPVAARLTRPFHESCPLPQKTAILSGIYGKSPWLSPNPSWFHACLEPRQPVGSRSTTRNWTASRRQCSRPSDLKGMIAFVASGMLLG